MDLINKLANTIEKSLILHFVNEEGFDDLKDFEFDRPVIGFATDMIKVKSYETKMLNVIFAFLKFHQLNEQNGYYFKTYTVCILSTNHD